MTIGIYLIKCVATGRGYVGSSLDVIRRLGAHRRRLRKGLHPSNLLQNAFNKYGDGAFEFNLVEECQASVLVEREQHWIDALRSGVEGFNIANADRRIPTPKTPEWRKKLSLAAKGKKRPDMTPERCREMQARSAEIRRRSGNCRGRPIRWKNTPEARLDHILKLADKRRGVRATEETRKKISDARKGKPGRVWTEDQKAKVSAAHRGRKVSEETREKLRASWARRKASSAQARNLDGNSSGKAHEGVSGRPR